MMQFSRFLAATSFCLIIALFSGCASDGDTGDTSSNASTSSSASTSTNNHLITPPKTDDITKLNDVALQRRLEVARVQEEQHLLERSGRDFRCDVHSDVIVCRCACVSSGSPLDAGEGDVVEGEAVVSVAVV